MRYKESAYRYAVYRTTNKGTMRLHSKHMTKEQAELARRRVINMGRGPAYIRRTY